MVLTRLWARGPSYTLRNANLISRGYFTRHVATDASSSGIPLHEDTAEVPTAPKKPKRITKKYQDLPNTYTRLSGLPATPLEEWNPENPTVTAEPGAKPPRKTRTKKATKGPGILKEDSPEEKSSEPPKLIKVIKPTTFLSRQILANLKQFPHCLLLTRVGQFYESYFDQAVEISRLLNIKLTSRKWNGERVAMCGFPLLHLDKHLKTLVQQEKRFVAMCEEFVVYTVPNAKEFERRITRIITPGTLIDESFLNPLENNYLLAIGVSGDSNSDMTRPVGLAWIDISTGEFFSKHCKLENIRDELARIAPREVVLESSLQNQLDHPIFSSFIDSKCLVSYTSLDSDSRNGIEQSSVPAEEHDGHVENTVTHLSTSSTDLTQDSFSVNLLTKFLQDNLLEHMPHLDAPLHESAQDRMQIDLHTIQGLEIRESGDEGSVKGSLTSVVKRTTTSGGARLLARWLCSPSTSMQEINSRQSLVSLFRSRTQFRMDVCDILKEVNDVGRLCQKFLLGRADFSDLIDIRATTELWVTLRKRCEHEKFMENVENPGNSQFGDWASLHNLFSRMTCLDSLSEKISEAIMLNPDATEISDLDGCIEDAEVADDLDPVPGKGDSKKWSIDPRCSEKLVTLHDTSKSLLEQKDAMEQFLQEKYDAPSLTLRSAPGQGMFIHLARSKRDKKNLDLDPAFYAIGESLTTKSYIYRDWAQLGNRISETLLSISQAEKEVFEKLSLEVVEHARELRQNSQVIDELDAAISFALLAEEMNFVRPEITDDGSYCVINGRHPSVEMALLSAGRQFTPNSVDMTFSSNLHLITGPNMAGKSTLLRQTAIIAILAQVGSYVPADFARVSIVDKLFSRIGAKDDLFRDRSTFMVEMLETADILRRATEKSLVIMDEVGRGTTVKDGLAIAFAALHHLVTVNKSRCLFATHFHELAEMVGNSGNLRGSGVFDGIRFYCSDVDDAGDGHFTYSYRLRPGINRDSHGLKVARLAGVPSSAMDVATDTLSWLRKNGSSNIEHDYNDFSQCILNRHSKP